MDTQNAAAIIVAVILSLAVLAVLWALPIVLGVRVAKRKGYPPEWMWFGIHPVGGWVAFIVLSSLAPRIQCENCGGFVKVNFRICPHCHVELARGRPGPPMPPGGRQP
jgi:hypothetical protein